MPRRSVRPFAQSHGPGPVARQTTGVSNGQVHCSSCTLVQITVRHDRYIQSLASRNRGSAFCVSISIGAHSYGEGTMLGRGFLMEAGIPWRQSVVENKCVIIIAFQDDRLAVEQRLGAGLLRVAVRFGCSMAVVLNLGDLMRRLDWRLPVACRRLDCSGDLRRSGAWPLCGRSGLYVIVVPCLP